MADTPRAVHNAVKRLRNHVLNVPPPYQDRHIEDVRIVTEALERAEAALRKLQQSRPDGDATEVGSAAHYWLTTVVPLAALSPTGEPSDRKDDAR